MAAIDLKQTLGAADYFGALAVWCIFFAVLFLISVTCINYCCIQKTDDITVIEEWGYNHKVNMRLGVHRPSIIARHIRHPIKRDDH